MWCLPVVFSNIVTGMVMEIAMMMVKVGDRDPAPLAASRSWNGSLTGVVQKTRDEFCINTNN